MLELYENIKKYRTSLQMSQDELAKKAGYTDRSSIAKIEKGLVDLPQSKIILFANIFGVTASELMGNDGITDYDITPCEIELIKAYRSSDSISKEMVKRILNIADRLDFAVEGK